MPGSRRHLSRVTRWGLTIRKRSRIMQTFRAIKPAINPKGAAIAPRTN